MVLLLFAAAVATFAAVVVDFFNNIITKQLVCLGLIPDKFFAFFLPKVSRLCLLF